MNSKPVVAVFSEGQSDNLGDQAIFRSLNIMLSPYFDVRSVSFSGIAHPEARSYKAHVESRVPIFRKIFRFVPSKVKAWIRWCLLGGRRQYEVYCKQSIQGSEFVVVGGGQLIKNNVSLFCNRLWVIEKILRGQGVNFALVGVGVDSKMNRLTWRLVSGIVRSADFVIVRDNLSSRRIKSNVKSSEDSLVIPDLAFALENSVAKLEGENRYVPVAINVMDVGALLKGRKGGAKFDASDIIEAYCEMARSLSDGQTSCKLFTSGASSDLRAADYIKSEVLSRTGIEVSVFHPSSLDDLLGFLSEVRNVIALRMHVGILAYISGCNPICVNWDDKVRGVWSTIGQDERVIELDDFLGKANESILFDKLNSLSSPSATSLSALAKTVRTGVTNQVEGLLTDGQYATVPN